VQNGRIMEKKLSELEPGQQAIIKKFSNNELYLKLMEMGCIPGEVIILEQVAPLGDPISVSISGYSLSLRLNESENIFVETIDYQLIK
jgi:ferrous iron transport protein A